MNKLVVLVLVCLLCLSGCTVTKVVPEATLQPGISKPEGGIVSTDPKIVEGRIKKLTKDSMTLSVQSVDWELALTEQAAWEIEKLNEKGVEIVVGTFVMAYYEELEDGTRQATRVERVRMN